MKLLKCLVIISITTMGWGTVSAQDSVAGTWQGDLTISPELDLVIQFVIEDDGGAYSVLINSPNNPAINNLQASSISISGNSVNLEFDQLSGAFNGELADGNLTGQWTQLTDSFPLVLTPYIESALTPELIALLSGAWSASIEGPNNVANVVVTFETDAEGVLSGTLGVPAQGVTGIELADLVMVESMFSFTVPQARVRYEGQFNDESLVGTWSQGAENVEVTFTKGENLFENITVYSLTEADKDTLLGTWQGQMGPLTLVVSFSRDEEGNFTTQVDSPVQNVTDLPVTEVSFLNNQLTLVLALGAEFIAELNGTELVGTWNQAGMSNPLTLSKED